MKDDYLSHIVVYPTDGGRLALRPPEVISDRLKGISQLYMKSFNSSEASTSVVPKRLDRLHGLT